MANTDEAKRLASCLSDESSGYMLEFSNLEWDLYARKVVGFRIQERSDGLKGNSFKEFPVLEDISDHPKLRLIYSLDETIGQVTSIRQFENPSSYKPPKMNSLVTLLTEGAYHEGNNARLLDGAKLSREVNLEYVQQLPTRVSKDIQDEDFDSILTRSNAMIDGALEYVIKNTRGRNIDNNTVRFEDLRDQAFERLNIEVNEDMGRRIKALVGTLDTLLNKILRMRSS